MTRSHRLESQAVLDTLAPRGDDVPAATPGGRPGAMLSRTEIVLGVIKHSILTGELMPGQALVEAELAERLGVSKTPVREALKTLAGTGLIVMLPYKGATVREVDSEHARALYDMRLLLEPAAAGRAALAGVNLEAARAALDVADAADDAAERSLANRAFHRVLYAACGNPLLVKALDELRDQTALVSSAAWSGQAGHPASWRHEAREHRAILAAAQARDAVLVRALVRGHISSFLARNFPENEVG
jgi:DNA-binding GntR family transcriptional regulator